MSTATVTAGGQMEVYTVRDRGEWATVCFREWSRTNPPHTPGGKPHTHYGAELLINSTFGAYSYTWSSMGEPFREFFSSCDRSYILGKLISGHIQVFDPIGTRDNAVREVFKARRGGGRSDWTHDQITGAQARDAFAELDQIGDDDSQETVLRIIGDIPLFKSGEYWYLTTTKENTVAMPLWDHVLAPLQQKFLAEIAARKVAA